MRRLLLYILLQTTLVRILLLMLMGLLLPPMIQMIQLFLQPTIKQLRQRMILLINLTKLPHLLLMRINPKFLLRLMSLFLILPLVTLLP